MVRYAPAIFLLMFLGAGCQAPMGAEVPVANFNAPPLAVQAPPVQAPTQKFVAPPSVASRKSQISSAREWVPAAKPRPWQWIVIHHSATPNGSVTSFDRMHKQQGWDECGYHFVVGNGDGAADGQIQVGPRWPKQKWGAHAKTADNKYNEFGIGICLVGNFDESRPTEKQLASLARLTAYLQQTYGISGGNVLGHSGTGKQTACPGRHMNIATVRKMAERFASLPNRPTDDGATASAVELLQPIR